MFNKVIQDYFIKLMNLHAGGLSSALETATILVMTVLMPLPLPSTLAVSLGILYR